MIRIVWEFCSRGLTTLVLTRGYRGEWEKEGGLVRPRSALVDPRLAGDEPVLIQERVFDAWIGVGSDRLASYATARAAMGRDPEVVVLDDGFQQFRIARDLDVIAVISHEFGESWFCDRAEEVRGLMFWVWENSKFSGQ